jgi:hypothetical protein
MTYNHKPMVVLYPAGCKSKAAKRAWIDGLIECLNPKSLSMKTKLMAVKVNI